MKSVMKIVGLRAKLQTLLLFGFIFVVLIQAVITGGITHNYIEVIMEKRIGEQALELSRIVSSLPEIRQGLQDREVEQIQPLAELLRSQTRARFIVVGDREGIRFSHPIPERIGQKRVGGDNQRALEKGESYVSKAVGSLGPSIRGKSPVLDAQGQVIGVTSVGYMLDAVAQTISSYQRAVMVVVFISLLVSVLTGVVLSRYFKRILFGLEPEEIARLYEERNTTLETIREGVISIDAKGLITTFNKTALHTLGIKDEHVAGRSIRDIFPQSDLLEVLKTGQVELDREVELNDKKLIVNRMPIVVGDEITGVVSSFRAKDELELLSRRIAHIEQYTETLRAQSHDYANKLHTISGLIQIGATDQALELIGQESRGLQELVHLLVDSICDPVLAGCVLGKYNRANELGLKLVVDSSSHLHDIPKHISSEKLVSLVGNIIDNAFEATRESLARDPQGSNEVTLSMSDYGHDLILEVEDNGPGIAEKDRLRIFNKGMTSKDEAGHGYGLYLVKSIIDELHGQVSLERSDQGGTRFIVYFPKNPSVNV